MRTLFVAVAIAMALPSGAEAADPEHGKVVFNKCRVCHQVGETAKNSVGPILNGIVGRPAASLPDYNYSVAMKGSNLTWDEATLDQYLTSPRTVVQGTKMSFAGLADAGDRADLIAWLKQFDASGKQKQAAADPARKLFDSPTDWKKAQESWYGFARSRSYLNQPIHFGNWTSF